MASAASAHYGANRMKEKKGASCCAQRPAQTVEAQLRQEVAAAVAKQQQAEAKLAMQSSRVRELEGQLRTFTGQAEDVAVDPGVARVALLDPDRHNESFVYIKPHANTAATQQMVERLLKEKGLAVRRGAWARVTMDQFRCLARRWGVGTCHYRQT